MKKLLASLMCALLVFGCELTTSDDPTSLDQTYLFEIEGVNQAWGWFWEGTYVDNQGRVYRYTLGPDDTWHPGRGDVYTEADLRRKYSFGDSLIGMIDLSTLRNQAARIPAASKGTLSDPVYPCRDAGTVTFRTFLYEADTGLYRPVLLYQAGDQALQNYAASAQVLVGWLKTVDERFAASSCTP